MSNFQGGRNNPRNFRGRGPGNTSSVTTRGPNMGNNAAQFSNGPQNRVNPWEPGVVPGAGGNIGNMGNIGGSRSAGGLLPTPSGLLQQPSSMQNAQLAVANKVLSLLLPNMQQSQRQNQVSPLLGFQPNRGGLLPLNPPLGFPNQNFGGQSQQQGPQGGNCPVGQTNPNNLGPNRPRPLLLGKRAEPYNKMGNRNQRQGQINDGRQDTNNFQRNAGRNSGAGPKNFNLQARNNKERKEDVRDEKRVDRSASDLKCKEEVSKIQDSYADIPSDFFYCHVCPCKMWDPDAFASHIKSKSHLSMINRLEEKYKKETETMRQDMKAEESQKQMSELNQRRGKPVPSSFREYCTMCNLHFHGNLSAHRKSSRHQSLKAFLHPTCQLCSKEFATRIDYDHHLLSAGHLSARKKQTSKCVKQEDEPGSKESVEKKVMAQEKSSVADQIVVAQLKDKEDGTDMSDLSVPTFDSNKEIGMELLQEKTGYLCRCCNRFLSSSADAKTHCRSRFHYDKYVAHMNMTRKNVSQVNQDVKLPTQDESAKIPSNETNQEITETKSQDILDPEDEEEDKDDEGNWKRRKVSTEDDVANKVQNVIEIKNTVELEGPELKPEEKKESSSPQSTIPTTDSAQEAKSLGIMDTDEEQGDDLEKTILIEPQSSRSILN